MRLTNDYDILEERCSTDDLLLLHPDLIEGELEKIEKNVLLRL